MIHKTKIIRNDLEAALKAKIKLSSSSSSNINDASTIGMERSWCLPQQVSTQSFDCH